MRISYALFSGGFDSTLAILKYLNENNGVRIVPVFFNYGQKAFREESLAVTTLSQLLNQRAESYLSVVEHCRIYNLEADKNQIFSWSQSSIIRNQPNDNEKIGLENRNIILLSCLTSVALSDLKSEDIKDDIEIITGFANNYYDTDISFIKAINELFKAMNQRFRVVAPLIPRGSKEKVGSERIVKLAHSLDAFGILKKSWSCYFPDKGKPCEYCDPCQKRKDIFQELGMKIQKRKPKHKLR